MNRIQNHIEGGISDVYDQHEYAEENKHVMETVASKIMSLVEGASSARSFLSGRARRDLRSRHQLRRVRGSAIDCQTCRREQPVLLLHGAGGGSVRN
jgi:hypothetical protein